MFIVIYLCVEMFAEFLDDRIHSVSDFLSNPVKIFYSNVRKPERSILFRRSPSETSEDKSPVVTHSEMRGRQVLRNRTTTKEHIHHMNCWT